MKPIAFLGGLGLSFFLLYPLLTISQNLPDNVLSRTEAAEGWELLFDGKNLNQWEKFGAEGLEGWEAVEGELRCTGESGGDLITKADFDHFELSLEWNIPAGGNSGIMFHVVNDPKKYNATYVTGPEYQLLDDAAYADANPKNLTGGNYDMHAPYQPPVKKAGEWNHTRIRVEDGMVTHWLNGRKLLSYELWTEDWEKRVKKSKWKKHEGYGKATTGRIALQDHDHPIRFRNLKIKSLGNSLYNGQDLQGWKIHGTEKWYVEEGELVCESGPDEAYGYLATEKTYKNFDLRVEFRQEANGNSGVFFRSSLEGTKISGWQVEVAPPDHDTGGIYESYGRGWLQQIPPAKEKFLLMGSWNTLRVRVVGQHVETWLNGHKMVDFHDAKIGEAMGSFALQIHDGGGIKVRWRNLRVIEL